MKGIVRFFSSKKVGIILLICLAITSIIGTVIPQGLEFTKYILRYGESMAKFLKLVGFLDLYHSPWYIALLVLFSINLLFCTSNRLTADLKRLKRKKICIDEELVKHYRLFQKKSFSKSISECRDSVISVLKTKMGGHITESEGGGGEIYLFSEKNRHSWTFFHIAHVSILIILIGAILTSIFGLKGYMQINEGESSDKFYEYSSKKIHDLGFTVKCERFDIEFYENTTRPKDYKSFLVVYDSGKEVLKKVIEVNNPLTYKGMTLYQSSYGEDTTSGAFFLNVQPHMLDSNEPIREFRATLNEAFDFIGFDGKKRQVQVVQFFPDFVMNEQRQAFSKSNQLNNPAIRLKIKKEAEEPFYIWSFLRYPDPHMMKKGEYVYVFKDYKGKIYTGLQVGSNPWIWVVWLGSIFLVLGVTFILFVSHQRIWAKLTPHNKMCDLVIAGISDKNKYEFEMKFNDIWKELTRY